MSNREVTITLGRSGQVVTKGHKRSRTERFGRNNPSPLSSASKWHRGDGVKQRPHVDGVNGTQISKGDLRLKLIRKRQSKGIQNVVEESRNMGPPRNLSTNGQHPARFCSQRGTHYHNQGELSRSITPEGFASNLDQVDSLGRLYSSQTMAGSRARSPYRYLTSSRELSPPRSFDEIRDMTPMRTADVPRSGRYYRNEAPNTYRMPSSTPFPATATTQAGNAITRMAPTVVPKALRMGEEPLSVTGFLHSLGLRQYAALFQAEEAEGRKLFPSAFAMLKGFRIHRLMLGFAEDDNNENFSTIDMAVLNQMEDKDLKDMGLPMGPRKKILQALLPQKSRHR